MTEAQDTISAGCAGRRTGVPASARPSTRRSSRRRGRRPSGAARPGGCSRGASASAARSFLALRLMGAVHRLVLMGRLPELAALYPSAGGEADVERAPRQFIEALAEPSAKRSRAHLDRPVQTNEVGRCAGLSAASCVVAARDTAAAGGARGRRERGPQPPLRPLPLLLRRQELGRPRLPRPLRGRLRVRDAAARRRARRSPSDGGATRARSTRARRKTG